MMNANLTQQSVSVWLGSLGGMGVVAGIAILITRLFIT